MPWTLPERKALSLDIRYVWFELAQDVVVGRLDDAKMNAARLTRRWQEAAGDPARMVEALVDEINDPATGLVTRDFLRAELAQVREEIATLRGELRSEIAALRGEITGVRGEITGVRGELRSEIAAVRGEIAAMRGEIWRVVLTVFGAQVVLVGMLVTILFQVLR